MRWSIAVVLVIVLGWAAAPVAGWGGRVKHPDDLKFPELTYVPPDAGAFSRTLAAGPPAFIAEDHEVPTFDLEVTVRTGILYEPREKAGLASMTAYLLRNGGTKSLTVQELDDRLEYLAGTISSRMDLASATVSVSTLSKDLDEALDLLVEVIRYPAFDPEEVERYRRDRIQELKLRNSETRKIEPREWAFLLYGDHPCTEPFRETQASLQSITIDDLRAFHEQYFFPQNFIIAAAGDFDASELAGKLDSAMGEWPSRDLRLPEIPEATWVPGRVVYIVNKEDVNQARVRLGHLGIRRDNPDYFSVSLMNYVLGGGDFSSRITQRVRSDEGLSYNQGSVFTTPVLYDGEFHAYFQTKSATVAYGTEIILEEIERIREELVDAETLENAKQNLRSMLVNRFVDKWTAVRTFADDLLTDRPKDYWAHYEENIQAVSPAQVREAAQKYLLPDRLVFLIVGNGEEVKAGGEKGSARLTDFGTVVDLPLPNPLTLER